MRQLNKCQLSTCFIQGILSPRKQDPGVHTAEGFMLTVSDPRQTQKSSPGRPIFVQYCSEEHTHATWLNGRRKTEDTGGIGCTQPHIYLLKRSINKCSIYCINCLQRICNVRGRKNKLLIKCVVSDITETWKVVTTMLSS